MPTTSARWSAAAGGPARSAHAAHGDWLVDYPFAERLYPARWMCRHAQQWGPTVILSDGDAVFQPRKVDRSGLWTEVDGRVLIYVHKEQELDDVERLYPARHYVMIDDKLRILDAIKETWGERVTTVFPRQGHYATDPEILAQYPHGRYPARSDRRSGATRPVDSAEKGERALP